MRLGAQFLIQNSKFLIRTVVAVRIGRALTKTFLHSPFMGANPSGLNKRLYIRSYENKFSTT